MKCPHCHKKLVGVKPSYDRERDQLARALGRCVDCNTDKTDDEMRHWRCDKCRERRRGRMARKRLAGSLAGRETSMPAKPTGKGAWLR